MIVKTICITNTSFLTNIIRFCITEKVGRKEKKRRREKEKRKRWNGTREREKKMELACIMMRETQQKS